MQNQFRNSEVVGGEYQRAYDCVFLESVSSVFYSRPMTREVKVIQSGRIQSGESTESTAIETDSKTRFCRANGLCQDYGAETCRNITERIQQREFSSGVRTVPYPDFSSIHQSKGIWNGYEGLPGYSQQQNWDTKYMAPGGARSGPKVGSRDGNTFCHHNIGSSRIERGAAGSGKEPSAKNILSQGYGSSEGVNPDE
ncbi:predicted protein [Uncinocarpus reesii 1704]|uniref:Uncharacterized protein n=1 Tax=Uncinocarpus reesii (strain UAMH 1704) TaxID=336963 RepID=C4JR47_UNCRE|nr:uncharacterized protein UREG_03529 [Uncinocarpus reesii 1704]EEP78683.1 predicted protein [Uncinocarpus reesii 1704]